MRFFVDTLSLGITQGAVFALIALGYTLVYGIIELINFAHGDVFTIGAFIGLNLIALFGMQTWSPALLIPGLILLFAITMALNGLLGVLIERVAYRPLRNAPRLVGININRIIAITFFIGSGLAAAGGIIYGFYNESISFDLGFRSGLIAFTAAVFGGIGNVVGASLGGFIIGLILAFADSYTT